jgi:hypothetical protein
MPQLLKIFAIIMAINCLACYQLLWHPPVYDSATRNGNQCHNECVLIYGDDDNGLDTCFANCYRYHGGVYTEGPTCILSSPTKLSKDPKKGQEKTDEVLWTEPAGLTNDEKAPTPLY